MLTASYVKDTYVDGDGVGALTLRFSFTSKERTLTKQELQPLTDAIAEALDTRFGMKLKL